MNLKDWIKTLTAKQKNKLIEDLYSECSYAEAVRMGDFAPYWTSCGDPLVEGQKIWSDEDA